MLTPVRLSRISGSSDIIDIKKLERETDKLLFLGFLVAVTFHAALFSIGVYKKTEVRVVKPIQVELIIRPPRPRKPFILNRQDIMKRILRKRFLMRKPSGKFMYKSLLSLRELLKIADDFGVIIDRKMMAEMIAEVIAEIDSTYYIAIKDSLDDAYLFVEDTGDFWKIAREPEQMISLKEELLSIDDLDTGEYKGLVVRDMGSTRRIQGFVYIPVDVRGSVLRPAEATTVAGLMEGFKKYTGIRVTVDPYLFLDSPIMSKYPFLYISADRLFDLSTREKENLEKYFTGGGFALLDPYSISAYVSMKKMIGESLGDHASIYPIPDDHPIYRCFFEYEEPPVLFPPLDESLPEDMLPSDGLWLNNRLIAVIPPSPFRPFGPAWSDYKSESRFENHRFRMAVNSVVFALIREGSRAKKYINTAQSLYGLKIEFLHLSHTCIYRQCKTI